MNKTASQILQEARQLVEAGWCQGPYYKRLDDRDYYCAVGAVMRAAGTDFDTFSYARCDAAEEALSDAARGISHGRFPCALSYNEARGRTKQQVLALFDRALTEVTK